MISYREMMQLKIIQRKRNIGHSLEGFQMQNFHCLLPRSNDPLTSQHWCLAICMDSCQPGTITWALVFRVLLVLHFHRHNRLIDWLPTWLNSVFRSIDTMWLKAPPWITWLFFLVWSACTLDKDIHICYDIYITSRSIIYLHTPVDQK